MEVLEAEASAGVGSMPARRTTFAVALTAACLLGAGLSGCSPLAQLPDFAKLPERVLTKDEQQGKVHQMIEKAQTHQSDAAKQIERER
jgi:hypothetical protein